MHNTLIVGSYFQLLGKEEILKLVDQCLKMFKSQGPIELAYHDRIFQVQMVRAVTYRINGDIDKYLDILQTEILPFRENVLRLSEDPVQGLHDKI